jgi:plasmid stability protein
MPQLLVRDLDTGTVERLKLRAQRHGRSLQGEVKAILQAAATFSMGEAGSVAEQWQRKLAPQTAAGQAGSVYRDSAEAIREDRER